MLIFLCAHMEWIRNFDLLKAFGYIERVVKSEKTCFTSETCVSCSELPSYVSTMVMLFYSEHFRNWFPKITHRKPNSSLYYFSYVICIHNNNVIFCCWIFEEYLNGNLLLVCFLQKKMKLKAYIFDKGYNNATFKPYSCSLPLFL